MKYRTTRVSGNTFTITLIPSTAAERELLQQNQNSETIVEHYHTAVKETLGADVHLASLAANADFPYSAIIEIDSGA